MQNVGSIDRIIRVILAVILVAAPFLTGWAFWANPLAFWASIAVGLVLAATAAVSFCPIYYALGLRTLAKRIGSH
jgi:DUF2892 family protein